MEAEQYLTHPMFGLLYLVCPSEELNLYTTLYSQQLFFLASTTEPTLFEPISREQARRIVEARVKQLRQRGSGEELKSILLFHQQHF